MKHAITYFLALFVCYSCFSQVGIGNTDPKAQLDISAGITPSAKDGILIPRLDEFPTGVDANQDGMLLFIGNGAPTKGFYYWDSDAMGWITVGKSNVEKIDDLSDGKSDVLGSSIFLGVGSGANDNGTDNRNVGVGYGSLFTNTTGGENTAFGYQSLFSNTSGNFNIALGSSSLKNNVTGDLNLALGHQSLERNTIGEYNIAIGVNSLANNETGSVNVTIGNYSLFKNISGIINIAIGPGAGYHSIGNSNIFIGYRSGYNETGDNKLYIENSNADEDNALIYGEFDNNILRTNSEFQIGNPTGTGYALPTTDGTSGQVLSTDGNGQVSFITPPATFSLARIRMSSSQSLNSVGWNKINFNTVDFDINSDFNTTNDEFIAPATGYYRINAICLAYSVPNSTTLYGISIYVNGTRVRYKRYNHTGPSNFLRVIDQVLEITAGDAIDIRFYNGAALSIASSSQQTSFEIERIR